MLTASPFPNIQHGKGTLSNFADQRLNFQNMSEVSKKYGQNLGPFKLFILFKFVFVSKSL